MKVKIVIAVILLFTIGVYFFLSAPHRVMRIQAVYDSVFLNDKEDTKLSSNTLTIKDTKSLENPDTDNKIKAQYSGVVVSMTKDTVMIENTHDKSITEYKNFQKINPVVKVGKTIKQGFTLGRTIEIKG